MNFNLQLFLHEIGKSPLLSTPSPMVPIVFEDFDFKGYFAHSIFWKCLMRFFGSGTSPWTQISYEGTIFDAGHDDLKIFRIFENFGKSRNQFWDPPVPVVKLPVGGLLVSRLGPDLNESVWGRARDGNKNDSVHILKTLSVSFFMARNHGLT